MSQSSIVVVVGERSRAQVGDEDEALVSRREEVGGGVGVDVSMIRKFCGCWGEAGRFG